MLSQNGALLTLGLVGAVAAVGTVARRGSRSMDDLSIKLNNAREDLLRTLRRGPGTLRHETDEGVVDETYVFTHINAAAIRTRGGGWTPATYRSSYDNHTGTEDGDYKEVGASVPRAEDALLIALQRALHFDIGEGAMARGGFNRKDRKGSRSIPPSFTAAVARGFDRAARMLDTPIVVESDDSGGYGTDRLGLGATPAPNAIRTSSIVGPKVRDGWQADLYDAEGDDHAVGIYPSASAALVGALVSLVMDTIQNTVTEEGMAQAAQGSRASVAMDGVLTQGVPPRRMRVNDRHGGYTIQGRVNTLWKSGNGVQFGTLQSYDKNSFYQGNNDVTKATYKADGVRFPVLCWFDNKTGQRIA